MLGGVGEIYYFYARKKRKKLTAQGILSFSQCGNTELVTCR